MPKDMEDRPPSCQFGVAKLWEKLPLYEGPKKGKIVLIEVTDDEHISKEAYDRYLTLAKRVNTNVKHMVYTSKINWRHADHFYSYEVQRREFMEAVFK